MNFSLYWTAIMFGIRADAAARAMVRRTLSAVVRCIHRPAPSQPGTAIDAAPGAHEVDEAAQGWHCPVCGNFNDASHAGAHYVLEGWCQHRPCVDRRGAVPYDQRKPERARHEVGRAS